MKHLNNYLIKALDAYPCNLEEAMESLQYALSYDDTNPYTLVLLGRVYAEQFFDYKEAIRYFENAMEIDVDNTMVHAELIKAFIQNEDFDKARNLIDFALKIKGGNKDIILIRSTWLYEKQGLIKEANAELKKVKDQISNNDYAYWIEKCETRLKAKSNNKKKKVKKK